MTLAIPKLLAVMLGMLITTDPKEGLVALHENVGQLKPDNLAIELDGTI